MCDPQPVVEGTSQKSDKNGRNLVEADNRRLCRACRLRSDQEVPFARAVDGISLSGDETSYSWLEIHVVGNFIIRPLV